VISSLPLAQISIEEEEKKRKWAVMNIQLPARTRKRTSNTMCAYKA
jgi:hypothetical protein